MKLSDMSDKDKLELESTARQCAGLVEEYNDVIDRMKNLAVSLGIPKQQADSMNPVAWCMECMASYAMVTLKNANN